MYTMNEACNCEVGRDPEVDKELDSLVQGSVVKCCTRAVGKTGDE